MFTVNLDHSEAEARSVLIPEHCCKEFILLDPEAVPVQDCRESVYVDVCEPISSERLWCVLINTLETQSGQLGLIKQPRLTENPQ